MITLRQRFSKPFSSPVTYKLITKIPHHMEKYIIFADLTKKIAIISIHSHQMTIVLLTVVIF